MKTYAELKDIILKKMEELLPEVTELSEWMADHPERSGKEYETSKKIVEFMRERGYEVEYPYAGVETAFKAVCGSNNHTNKMAFLAEYDALPGIGHACGHNVSGSISVLAALAMKDLQDELDCDFHLIGTPNEEDDGAKCAMVDQGIFDSYDMSSMVHLFDKNQLYGILLGLHQFEFTFHGKAAHGATAPWEGVNALNAAQLMMHGIDMLRQHVTPDVRMHGIYRNGGLAPNIVPEDASVEVYVRALDKKYHAGVDERVENCAKGAAIMTGCTYEKKLTAAMYDNMNILSTGVEALREAYEELGIELDSQKDHDTIFGSSDIGNVSFVCPTFHPTIKIVDRGIAIHTRDFEKNVHGETAVKALREGAGVLALQAAKIFGDEAKLQAVKEEFEASIKALK